VELLTFRAKRLPAWASGNHHAEFDRGSHVAQTGTDCRQTWRSPTTECRTTNCKKKHKNISQSIVRSTKLLLHRHGCFSQNTAHRRRRLTI